MNIYPPYIKYIKIVDISFNGTIIITAVEHA